MWTAKEAAITSMAREGTQEPRLIELHPEEAADYQAAKGLDEPVHEHLRDKTAVSPQGYTALIPNGRVWGLNGAILSSGHRLLTDVNMEFTWEFVMARRHSIARRWRRYPVTLTNETVGVLTYPDSRNYFHWMLDVVPRIHLLKRSGIPIDKYVLVKDPVPYQDEILNLLGIPADKRIYTRRPFHLKARRLAVASLPSTFTWSRAHYPAPVAYAKWGCEAVRNELIRHGNPPPSGDFERIYISRSNAKHRRLLNEENILRELLPLGFTVIHTDTMSVKDQIGIFSSAKVIAAPHGAALANLAFCSPGTKVIELFPPNYVPGYFWILSNYFGLDYYYLTGNSYKIPPRSWVGAADFTVDPGRLGQLLEKAGLVEGSRKENQSEHQREGHEQ